MRTAVVSWMVILLAVSGVKAQANAPHRTRPTRADFEGAVLDRAATEVPAHPGNEDCAPEVPTRRLGREDRARMLGRAVRLSSVRFAAVVRTATGRVDVNEALGYAFSLVVLDNALGAWRASSVSDLDVGDAVFAYDAPPVRIARVEDVDRDGQSELLLVLETHTETSCGVGYCTVRRSVIAEINESAVVVTANVETRHVCQASTYPQKYGTVRFRDVDNDSHPDIVVRMRKCPEWDYDETRGEAVEPTCERADEVYLWRANRYEQQVAD